SVNRAVIVHTRKEIIRIPSLRLAGFMEQYGDSFIRIHRTMVVNKDKIRRYNNSRLFVEINETGEKLPVGRTYSEYVRKAFDENRIRGYNR
ncbi:MAG: LytTR family transcriptional regulator DNA-binding domain-containing protein, partial [Eubacterium sp.]|nr:LytTR family transcriptional regulator DNA-binding domain-containing protein [Eubacterium sp.]